jgi:DNA-binding transcriptional regulator YdaS (Cro superfamily)
MKKAEVLKHFEGVSRVAELLAISPSAVSQWSEELPLLRQYQIEAASGGKLKASKSSLPKRVA